MPNEEKQYGRIETNFSYGFMCPECGSFNIDIDDVTHATCYTCFEHYDPSEKYGKKIVEKWLKIDFYI